MQAARGGLRIYGGTCQDKKQTAAGQRKNWWRVKFQWKGCLLATPNLPPLVCGNLDLRQCNNTVGSAIFLCLQRYPKRRCKRAARLRGYVLRRPLFYSVDSRQRPPNRPRNSARLCRPLSARPRARRCRPPVNRSQSLDHPAGLFPVSFDQGGPSAPDRLTSSIGVLLPIALCGRSSL